jgi:protein gp37
MKDSKIEWTHHTANLWWGCVGVHAGCDHCYAMSWAERWGHDLWGNDKPRKESMSVWKDLMKFQKVAKAAGEIHRVFVGSMMDIFERPMPVADHKGNLLGYRTDVLRNRLFEEVIPQCPNLMFLLLTKRPSHINRYIPDSWKINPPENVMFGTSPVDQATADRMIVELAQVKGKRFVSVEPQLAPVDLMAPLKDGGELKGVLMDHVDWVINGGESGPNRRPFNTDWGRQLRDDCKSAGVPFFFKQIDKVLSIPEDLMIRQFPETHTLIAK